MLSSIYQENLENRLILFCNLYVNVLFKNTSGKHRLENLYIFGSKKKTLFCFVHHSFGITSLVKPGVFYSSIVTKESNRSL